MGRPPKKNDRCPFKNECEMKCEYKNKELECDYYRYNSCPGKEIADQEEKRAQYASEHYTLKSDNGGTDMIIPALRTPPADKSQPVTDKYIEAVNLNRKILTNAQMVQQDLYEMCTGLKQMRDGKLYKELGYKNFEEYVETEVGFKRNQAYKYITIIEKLPSDFVSSRIQNGVQKLFLLATLDESERTELTEKTDIESASVRELKEQIKELQKAAIKREADVDKLRAEITQWQEDNESLSANNAQLEDLVTELKARPPKEIVIHSKEKTPDNSVSYDAYERECARYQNIIDGLEHDNLMLTRQAHAEKTALEAKLKEAESAESHTDEAELMKQQEEIGFSARYGQLVDMLTKFIDYIDTCNDRLGFLDRLFDYLDDVSDGIYEVITELKEGKKK